jgi:hypothetical protein
VLTVTHYLDELAGELERALKRRTDPAARLERCVETYANYCLRYPAFLDCTLALMRRPARELHESVSESVWLRLGQGMARCSEYVADTLRRGTESGSFTVEDPDYTANVLWTQILGTMHLARIRVGVRQLAPGVPGLFKVAPDDLVRTCVASAMATVGARP